MVCLNDLVLYYNTRMIKNREMYDHQVNVKGPDAAMILATVSITAQDGAYEAAMFSSDKLLRLMGRASEGYGGLVPVVTDGKHKTEANGWIIIPVGTTTRYLSGVLNLSTLPRIDVCDS